MNKVPGEATTVAERIIPGLMQLHQEMADRLAASQLPELDVTILEALNTRIQALTEGDVSILSEPLVLDSDNQESAIFRTVSETGLDDDSIRMAKLSSQGKTFLAQFLGITRVKYEMYMEFLQKKCRYSQNGHFDAIPEGLETIWSKRHVSEHQLVIPTRFPKVNLFINRRLTPEGLQQELMELGIVEIVEKS